MCCIVVQAQALSYEDLSEDLTLPGMGIGTTMWHMRPTPTPRNRRAPDIAFAPVAEEQPLFEEEEEEEEEEGEREGEGEGEGEGEEEEEEEMREEEEAIVEQGCARLAGVTQRVFTSGLFGSIVYSITKLQCFL